MAKCKIAPDGYCLTHHDWRCFHRYRINHKREGKFVKILFWIVAILMALEIGYQIGLIK